MEQLYIVINDKASLIHKTTNFTEARDVAASKDGKIVKRKTDLARFSGPQLVGLYNKLSGKKLKKFASKSAGIDQFWKFLVPGKSAAVSTKKKPTASAKKTAVKSKAKVKAKTTTSEKTESMSAMFRRLIVDDCSKEDTLSKVREAFPDKSIPDSYYAYYVRECIKKELIDG